MLTKKGFTLVELLVTIGIIGILATVTVTSVGSARAKARDAKRVSDIKQIQSGLELYNSETGYYPQADAAGALGKADTMYIKLCSDGFQDKDGACATPYLNPIPTDPTKDVYYQYTCVTAICNSYTLTFKLEGKVGSLETDSVATPAGLQ